MKQVNLSVVHEDVVTVLRAAKLRFRDCALFAEDELFWQDVENLVLSQKKVDAKYSIKHLILMAYLSEVVIERLSKKVTQKIPFKVDAKDEPSQDRRCLKEYLYEALGQTVGEFVFEYRNPANNVLMNIGETGDSLKEKIGVSGKLRNAAVKNMSYAKVAFDDCSAPKEIAAHFLVVYELVARSKLVISKRNVDAALYFLVFYSTISMLESINTLIHLHAYETGVYK